MPLPNIENFFYKIEGSDSAAVEAQLDNLFHAIGAEEFPQRSAQYLVTMTLPEAALPDNLKRFSTLVHDGITLLIAHTPYQRLRQVILSQLKLPRSCSAGERLLHLALHYPTLQKLGQIIARNSTVAEDIKPWLIKLEGEHQPEDIHGLASYIRRWQQDSIPNLKIELSGTVLAMASVAGVMRFKQYDDTCGILFEGVFKVLKPEIEHILQDELNILEKVLQSFEANSVKYGLENMKIAALFDTVRLDLAREIDLLAEQRNLAEAQEIYRHNDRILIPQLKDYCSPRITAMEYIPGVKITATNLPRNQRKHLASLLFEAIICIPLFQQRKRSLFHGDPHAGNILAAIDTSAKRPAIGLLDWTLSGHLSRNTRINLVGLLAGIMSNDFEKIAEMIEQLTAQNDNQTLQERLPQQLKNHMSQPDYKRAHPLKRSFWLLEKLTMDGVLFSAELILFRKAFFTLEGVLEDIYPGFNSENVMEEYVNNLVLKEMPQRLSSAFFSAADHSGDYQSMLSNQDLSKLSIQQSMILWQQMMNNGVTLFETQTKLNNDFFRYFNWFYR